MNDLITVKNLCKQYASFALQDVSFLLPRGYIMGFVGPNGAGKTTTIKALLGMQRPDSGTITLFGMPQQEGSHALREKIGVVLDAPFYPDDWKARDVAIALSPFYSTWDKAAFSAYLKKFSIDETKKIKELSRGMKVKLMLAVALSHGAELLILDEPTSGLDPVARDELMEILQQFVTDENKSVLFSTHITADLEKIADFITYIMDGKIVFTGEKDALLAKYRLVKGDATALTQAQKKLLLGCRTHAVGFEAMVLAADAPYLPQGCVVSNITLDEIIVFMNRGDMQ